MIKKYEKNPILKPEPAHSWEAEAAFNGCPVKKDKNIYLLYRAVSLPHFHAKVEKELRISDVGIASSRDGIHFRNRRRFIVPEYSWEKFGCEDPRVTKLDGKYYIFYTALSNYPFTAEGIKIGLAISKDLKKIDEKHLVTPFNAKAMALFPEKINGRFCAILTANTDKPPAKIAIAFFDKEEEIWSKHYWNNWYSELDMHIVPLLRKSSDQVEAGAPPIKTKHGWLLIYSYIRNYFSAQPIFGIEAALLNLKDPRVVIARTSDPLILSEEFYEMYGTVPKVVFPTGAFLKDETLSIYYGASDTTCCLATVKIEELVESMIAAKRRKITFTRAEENPIITPVAERAWEKKLTFNPAAIYLDGKVHIVYRAMSDDNTSVFGYATSRDGIHIDYREANPIYAPRMDFEKKLVPAGNSGCEDPRLTLINKNIYMCYTAFNGVNPPRIALTSISVDDFLARKWNWMPPVLISPPEWDNKDAAIFPEKVKGKYLIFHRIGHDIDIDLVPSLNFDGKTWLEEYRWLKRREWSWDSLKVGIAAPPVKTKNGWILLYHGVSAEDHFYRVGAVLLDLKDPTRIIGRTSRPIFEPETDYEKIGEVQNVVFPCGAVVIDKKLFIYYGGADKVIGVATIEINELLRAFE